VILVDTSVWVDHLRAGEAGLSDLLERGQVVTHPFVVGELALGNLSRRQLTIDSMMDLPQAVVAGDSEVLRFIDEAVLFGLGVGYVDAHLLAAARLSNASLWTRDQRLHAAADRLGVAKSNA
jgi:predicted nucleic acid-binding protein